MTLLPTQKFSVYPITIPSTKKKTTFRSFQVREEKLLLVAKESDDIDVIINTTVDVIKTCLSDDIDVSSLTIFDIEYLMTQIRAKSVGEIIDFEFPCPKNAEHPKIPVRVDLTKIEVYFDPKHSLKIPLFDDVGVMMRYPTISEFAKFADMDGIELVTDLIDYIYTGTEIFYAKDQTKEELKSWVLSLSKKQLDKIEDIFFNKMPVYQYIIEYGCKEEDCGGKETITLKGLKSFFF